MAKTKRMRMTPQEVLKPFSLTCLNCNAQATAYPYPLPNGTIFCSTCSPAWLESFVKFASNRLLERIVAGEIS